MHTLVEAIQDELAFYSHDLTGRITYLSKSAETVIQLSAKQALNHNLADFLGDNPINEEMRRYYLDLTTSPVARVGFCEFLGCGEIGAPIKVKYWRTHVLKQGIPIGFSGILQRLDGSPIANHVTDSIDGKELMARVESLTAVEFQVIEMVVDGHMNKESAAILNVAVRTIESRRSRAMAKLKSSGLSELVQTWVRVRQLMSTGKYNHIGK